MALLLNNAEAQASGTAVTAANVASITGGTDANAFDAAAVGASMAIAFDNAHPAHGSNAYKLSQSTTTTNITHLDWIASWASVTELWGAFYVYCSRVPPTSSIRLVSFRNAGAQICGIKWASGTGGIEIMNAAGASQITTPSQASGNLSINTLYRFEYHFLMNTGTGETGRVNIYLGDATTTAITSAICSGVNLGAAIDDFWIGFTTANFSSTANDALWLDSLNLNTTGFPGPGPYSAGGTPKAGSDVNGTTTDAAATIYLPAGVDVGSDVENSTMVYSPSGSDVGSDTENSTMLYLPSSSDIGSDVENALVATAVQQLRPDADNAVGGWAVAPLWSKVDEAVAGGDTITATAA